MIGKSLAELGRMTDEEIDASDKLLLEHRAAQAKAEEKRKILDNLASHPNEVQYLIDFKAELKIPYKRLRPLIKEMKQEGTIVEIDGWGEYFYGNQFYRADMKPTWVH